MKHKPGDVWIESFFSHDSNPIELFRIYEMTGSGSFYWPYIFKTKSLATRYMNKELNHDG